MGSGKKKREIKKIEKSSSRMITFSKRRKGLFKKADEFCDKTGGKIGVLVISPTGKPYPHGDIEELAATLSSSSSSGYSSTRKEAGNDKNLKHWLKEISVELHDLNELLRLKKQLLNVKDRINKAEVESWTL